MLVKPCKLCPTKRYTNTSWCYRHFKSREKQLREEKKQRKIEKHKLTKTYEKKTFKLLHSKAWKLISLDVRTDGLREDEFNQCYTCGVWRSYKELDCGHYWHDSLDFDKRNLKPQCDSCNRMKSGNLAVYGARLLRENGEEWMKQLEIDAKNTIYKSQDLLKIIEEIKDRLKLKGL